LQSRPQPEASAAETGHGEATPLTDDGRHARVLCRYRWPVGWWTRRRPHRPPGPAPCPPPAGPPRRTGSPGVPSSPSLRRWCQTYRQGGFGAWRPPARAMGANAGPFPRQSRRRRWRSSGRCPPVAPSKASPCPGVGGMRRAMRYRHWRQSCAHRRGKASRGAPYHRVLCGAVSNVSWGTRGASLRKPYGGCRGTRPRPPAYRRPGGFPTPSIALLPSTRRPARVWQRRPPSVEGVRSR
jgi:hypothetical protein